MSTPPLPAFVDSEVLKALIEDKTKVPGKDYLVIDVRDEDRVGGHIPGSVNIPSKQLPDQLPALVRQYADVPQLFFHCALSQIRGPKAAARWSEAVTERGGDSSSIKILRGGFGDWQRKHKDDKNLVEAYEAEYWIEDY
ncbi:Rhodanese-like domain-containing protein [Gamsiella multidivaricata]|uniref:Rhodanese-like domain-containing protein n=1 Tax=Gamsiella multidivaricata TaxID=101098 RepID=UPI00221FB552|nr:Rhodanese-like domain-containing protein [Gamsiella multidivaricata]KAG0353525.1 hypothetical protein BGZ54_002213 [Gamsiella multidivaricata]KAI7820993.1 Rhodanese-like domain-containing protein [Gamsiella multidivaricata]